MSILAQADAFEKDFTDAMQTLHVLAAKHDLPAPTLVLGPEWKAPVRSMRVNGHLLSLSMRGLQFFGIPIRFGSFEPHNVVFREIT